MASDAHIGYNVHTSIHASSPWAQPPSDGSRSSTLVYTLVTLEHAMSGPHSTAKTPGAAVALASTDIAAQDDPDIATVRSEQLRER